MSQRGSTHNSYKALVYRCGCRLDDDTWCRLPKSHDGNHDASPLGSWTAADDAASPRSSTCQR